MHHFGYFCVSLVFPSNTRHMRIRHHIILHLVHSAWGHDCDIYSIHIMLSFCIHTVFGLMAFVLSTNIFPPLKLFLHLLLLSTALAPLQLLCFLPVPVCLRVAAFHHKCNALR